MFDEEHLPRVLLDGSCHALAMPPAEPQGTEDEEVERALEKAGAIEGILG